MVAIPRFYLYTAAIVVLFIIGSVVTMTYYEGLEADIESVPKCLPEGDPPHGNSVWDGTLCMWVMDISIDVGFGIPTESELTKPQNQKTAQKLVDYTIKQYSLGGNSTESLDGLLFYKIGQDAFREVHVMKLQNQEYVAHYNPDKIGKTSLFLTVAFEPRDLVIEQLKNNGTAWINYETQRRDGTADRMMWLKEFDSLIFASGFELPKVPEFTGTADYGGRTIENPTDVFFEDFTDKNAKDKIESLDCDGLRMHIDGNLHWIESDDVRQYAVDRLQSCENRGN